MNDATIEFSITIPEEMADELIGRLYLHDFEGFWEDGNVLKAYVSATGWNEKRRSAVRAELRSFAAAHGISLPEPTTVVIPPKNWNAAWEATIQPVRVSPRVTVAPSWHPVTAGKDEIVLTIDPKMSFGTGHHETTRLVLTLLEPHAAGAATLLDVGTGTGILAIAAVKLGVRAAVGVDIDEWSYLNAIENVERNGEKQRIRILQGELADVPPGAFDIVTANIQRSVIEPILPLLRDRMAPSGILVLSGLLQSERTAMLSAFRQEHLTVMEERTENEWIAFLLHHDRRSY